MANNRCKFTRVAYWCFSAMFLLFWVDTSIEMLWISGLLLLKNTWIRWRLLLSLNWDSVQQQIPWRVGYGLRWSCPMQHFLWWLCQGWQMSSNKNQLLNSMLWGREQCLFQKLQGIPQNVWRCQPRHQILVQRLVQCICWLLLGCEVVFREDAWGLVLSLK